MCIPVQEYCLGWKGWSLKKGNGRKGWDGRLGKGGGGGGGHEKSIFLISISIPREITAKWCSCCRTACV